jgi:hypothetical protein
VGKIGGKATFEKYGKDHFSKAGKIGGQKCAGRKRPQTKKNLHFVKVFLRSMKTTNMLLPQAICAVHGSPLLERDYLITYENLREIDFVTMHSLSTTP